MSEEWNDSLLELARLERENAELRAEIESLKTGYSDANERKLDALAEVAELKCEVESEQKWAKFYSNKCAALRAELERLKAQGEDQFKAKMQARKEREELRAELERERKTKVDAVYNAEINRLQRELDEAKREADICSECGNNKGICCRENN